MVEVRWGRRVGLRGLGAISKEICSESGNGNAALQNFGYLASGIAIGVLTSFFFAKMFGARRGQMRGMQTRGQMRGMQTLSTVDSNDSDSGMEII